MTEASATPRPGPSTTTAAAVPAASAGVDGSEPVLALPPDTFLSILPGVEDLLELIYGVAEGRDVASDAVVSKVCASSRITDNVGERGRGAACRYEICGGQSARWTTRYGRCYSCYQSFGNTGGGKTVCNDPKVGLTSKRGASSIYQLAYTCCGRARAFRQG